MNAATEAVQPPAALKVSLVGLSMEQKSLGPGWRHVIRQGRVVKATPTTDHNPISGVVTEAPIEIHVTDTRNMGKITKSAPNFTEAPTQVLVTYSEKTSKPAKSLRHTPNYLVTPPQPNHSPIYEISDLSGNSPLDRCVDLTCQILASIPILPSGPCLLQSALITIVLFVAKYGSKLRRTKQVKALWLACWNADSVRGRKLELNDFLGQHSVPICLLNETHLMLGEVFQFANVQTGRQREAEQLYWPPGV